MGFVGASYPKEQNYSTTASGYIEKIRVYLGDMKQIKREYVDGCTSNVMGDYFTYVLEDKGWPLKVALTTSSGTVEFVSLDNPITQGYRYIVFSNSQDSITTSTYGVNLSYYESVTSSDWTASGALFYKDITHSFNLSNMDDFMCQIKDSDTHEVIIPDLIDAQNGNTVRIWVNNGSLNVRVAVHGGGSSFIFYNSLANLLEEAIIDISYESFIFSDKEIYDVYITVDVPGIPSSEETVEMVLLATALNLAEAEFGTFVMESSIKVSDGDTSYNPATAIQARQARIKWLKDKLEDLTKRDMSRIEGARVE